MSSHAADLARMEFFRDQAADQFERHTGSTWRPRSGSMVNHRIMISAMIDSRDFLAAKRRADTDVLLPAGPKVAFGTDFGKILTRFQDVKGGPLVVDPASAVLRDKGRVRGQNDKAPPVCIFRPGFKGHYVP